MDTVWAAFFLLAIGFVSCSELTVNSGGGSVAWCRNSEKGEWRHILSELFSGTNVQITEADCDDVGEGHLGLLITYKNGLKELFTRRAHQNIHHFIASALRKMSKDMVMAIQEKSDWDKLPKTVEYLVLYTHYRDSLEHVLFQQAALSGRVPEDSILVTVHEVTLLPDEMQDKAPSAFHLWLVEGSEWNNVHLNTHLLAPEQVREEFINLISRLKYAAIHNYNGEDPQAVYSDSGLYPLLVFHETEQKKAVIEDIIQPLVKEFRTFYAFVTIDVNEHPHLKENYRIEDNDTMPYIIIMDPKYTGGLHLDKDNIAYTPERLRNYLKSLVVPEENKNSSNVRSRGGEGVFLFDPHTLGVLTEEQEDASLLVGFCMKDTPECQSIHSTMSKAVKEAMSEHGARLEMMLSVTVCEDLEEVAKYQITEFPTVLLRYLGVWEAITDNTVANYVEIIKKFGRVLEGHDEL